MLKARVMVPNCSFAHLPHGQFIGRTETGVIKVKFTVNLWNSSTGNNWEKPVGPHGALSYTIMYCAVLYATEGNFWAEYLRGSEPFTRLTT